MESLGRASFAQICCSPSYRGGILDMGAAHLHPLKLTFGLARACVALGVQIFEGSEVTTLGQGAKALVKTPAGMVQADHVILATNGYSQSLSKRVARHVMPINNFIVATEPLGARAAEVLARDIAVADDRFVINYFRLSGDGRLLFGGGESYGVKFPRDVQAKAHKPMLEIFPHLKDVAIEYAWGGTLAITMKRMPYLARLAPNVLSASGYSGHGVGNAIQAGAFMAEAVQGQSSGFEAFACLPQSPFPGGANARAPLLALAMSWYSLRDRLGF
jgi:gamma-glutamylputrescine oxidase